MYQGGTRDIGITPSLKKSGGCYPKTAAPAYLVEFEGAGHFAWTDLTGNHHELINNSITTALHSSISIFEQSPTQTRRSDFRAYLI
jgi:hypothetical protein